MALPTDYTARKEFPLMTVLSAYFPDAIEALVALCCAGNKQHNIDEPKENPFYLPGDRVAWDRTKSTEEMETLMRHAWDHMRAKRARNPEAMLDADGILHIVKVFWRAGAEAQKTIEMMRARAAQDSSSCNLGILGAAGAGGGIGVAGAAGAPVALPAGRVISLDSRNCPWCGELKGSFHNCHAGKSI